MPGIGNHAVFPFPKPLIAVACNENVSGIANSLRNNPKNYSQTIKSTKNFGDPDYCIRA